MNNLLLVIVLSLATAQRDLGVDARLHSGFASKHMSTTREIIVWLPPGYATETEKRYPVLYMHDGQNVYLEWRIDDIAKPLIAAQKIEPLIIVMIANGGTAQSRADAFLFAPLTQGPAATPRKSSTLAYLQEP
jgi:predicted alpha/beta superfamily hydrolase